MNEMAIGLIGLTLLLGLFLTGLEMAFAMAIIGIAGYALMASPTAALSMAANSLSETLESYGITVIPLFILMGQIVFNGGVAKRIYDTSHRFFGHIPGGLAVATVVGAAIFKAMCGSLAATVSTFASVAVPEMDRFNYSRKLSTGIVTSVGTLGMLIPPAGTLIFLGIITQQSIGKLFIAGIAPGILLAILFVGVVLGWARIDPTIGPKSDRYPWHERMKTLPDILWPAIIFVVMIGGLMKGVFTPTEAGAIGLFCVLLITVVKRDISFAGIKQSTHEALRASSMVVLLLAASAMLGSFIAITDIPRNLSGLLADLPVHRHVTLAIIFVIYLLGGSFMDDLAFLILATPIFFPSMVALGYDPIWLCITISVVVGIGCVIPPVAMSAFIVKQITKESLGVIYGGVYPFLISLIVCLVLLFIFPQLATYLPAVLMK